MQPGRRYGITVEGGRVRFTGPLDTDPSAIVLDRAVVDADATAVDGRLVYSEPGARSTMVLAFMSVAGMTVDAIAGAIVSAAREARS